MVGSILGTSGFSAGAKRQKIACSRHVTEFRSKCGTGGLQKQLWINWLSRLFSCSCEPRICRRTSTGVEPRRSDDHVVHGADQRVTAYTSHELRVLGLLQVNSEAHGMDNI